MNGSVAAILLAAGKSSRMGSCKQLLPLDGGTVIGRCLDALLAAGLAEIVVVVSQQGQDVAEAISSCPVRTVVNPDPEGDMASSIRVGRDALTPEVGAVIVTLCDYPLISATTIQRLMEEQGNFPGRIVIPCHQGRRGHPLLFPRAVLDELSAGMILRDLVHRDPERIRLSDVDDPGILLDMDTPEDYRRLSERFASGVLLPG